MKIKFNYFFIVALFVAPLIGALIALPYGLFISSTPYYFSWPFGSFWQEFFALVAIIIFIYGLLFGYMALPWLAVIREDRITFHRLFRRKLVVPLRDIRKIEVLTNKVPVRNFPWSIANIIFYRENMKLYVVGLSHYVIICMYKVFEKQGIIFEESTRKPSKEEVEELVIK